MKSYVKTSTKRFLAYITLNPTATNDQIAEEFKWAPHSVANKISMLKQKGQLPKDFAETRARAKLRKSKSATVSVDGTFIAPVTVTTKPAHDLSHELIEAQRVIAEKNAIIRYLELRLMGQSHATTV